MSIALKATLIVIGVFVGIILFLLIINYFIRPGQSDKIEKDVSKSIFNSIEHINDSDDIDCIINSAETYFKEQNKEIAYLSNRHNTKGK